MRDSTPTSPDESDPGAHMLTPLLKSLAPADLHRDAPPAAIWEAIQRQITDTAAPVAPVIPLRRRPTWVVGAAAAAAVLIAGGGWLLSRSEDSTTVTAAADLTNEGLSEIGVGSSGHADVRKTGSGLVLDLHIDKPPARDGSYLEVWLIDKQVKGMVSLGPFHGDGQYAIPSGYDPANYPIVDVSIEAADGKPVHSSVSIVRGTLA